MLIWKSIFSKLLFSKIAHSGPHTHMYIFIVFVISRYLATGETFRSIAFNYRVGDSTVGKIVSECCLILWAKLAPIHMQVPGTSDEWKLVTENFAQRWDFPHCLGAIDGKHVVMKAPSNTGSLYYNYKGTFSTVLMALVHSNYKFIAIDVRAYGRNSDGGIFANSNRGENYSK